jgi:hypothetical protein
MVAGDVTDVSEVHAASMLRVGVCKSQSHVTTAGQSVSQSVSPSWCPAPSGLMTRF